MTFLSLSLSFSLHIYIACPPELNYYSSAAKINYTCDKNQKTEYQQYRRRSVPCPKSKNHTQQPKKRSTHQQQQKCEKHVSPLHLDIACPFMCVCVCLCVLFNPLHRFRTSFTTQKTNKKPNVQTSSSPLHPPKNSNITHTLTHASIADLSGPIPMCSSCLGSLCPATVSTTAPKPKPTLTNHQSTILCLPCACASLLSCVCVCPISSLVSVCRTNLGTPWITHLYSFSKSKTKTTRAKTKTKLPITEPSVIRVSVWWSRVSFSEPGPPFSQTQTV